MSPPKFGQEFVGFYLWLNYLNMTKLIFTIAGKIKFILTQILPYDLS